MTTAARPLGVTLLALLHVLQAVLLFVGGLALVVVGEFVRRALFRFPNLFRGVLSVIGAVLFIIALLYLALAYGLWTGKGWAWILSLILAILGIVGSLLSVVRGGAVGLLTLILDAVILYYLMRPNVKVFFGRGQMAPPQSAVMQTQTSTLSESSPEKNCPNCGAPTPSSDKFCAHCGVKIL